MSARMTHEPRHERTRTVNDHTRYYAVCTCGQVTTDSLSRESARRKITEHRRGNDRGMTPPTR